MIKKILLFGIGGLVLCGIAAGLWLAHVLSDLPDVSVLKKYRPPAAAEVLDKEGNVITHFYDSKFRVWAPISSLPDIVIRAVVIAEDDTFFGHEGVNYQAVWEALRHDVQKKRFARGGSTITQQMIKNVLLSKEKTITRKLREFVLARRAEEILTKRRILEIYLNEVEWGDNIYGIEAASMFYFDKHASALSAGEAALLAGMLPNPRYYNPFKRPEKAQKRRDQVLFNMHQAKVLTDEEYESALQSPVPSRPQDDSANERVARMGSNGRPCYQKALERMLLAVFDEYKLYRGGRTIRTTLDKPLQTELSAWEGSLSDKPSAEGEVLIVSEKGQIRAVVCSTDSAATLREKIAPPGLPPVIYDVDAVDPSSVTRDQIIYSAASGTQ
ncbi:MAG TPA: transglycosylase domain-containing protein [Nitrospirota bacterium]